MTEGIPVVPPSGVPVPPAVPRIVPPPAAAQAAPLSGNQSEMDRLIQAAREQRSGSTLPEQPSTPAPVAPVATPARPAAAPAMPPPAGASAIEVVETSTAKFDLDAALGHMIEAGGSDLHVTVGIPPSMRLHGTFSPIPGTPTLDGTMIHEAVYSILTSKQQAMFEEHQELDLAYTISGVSRFRVNVLRQKTEMAAVFRAIPWDIKSLDSLGMPPVVNSFAQYERGFVLVTGPTGSGKSTTLAAIIDEVNRTRSAHIMTIEDPIEFIHTHKRSIINQREVGADTHSFKNALKHVLRQDPDIILVGELRDLETIQVALTAAETGHLVFATLHTQSAQETVSRIVDVFPEGAQAQVQTQLAATLKAVLCQTLVKKRGGGRVAAAEIMVVDDGIANQIRKGVLHQIQSSLQTGSARGMQTLDKHLATLALNGVISYQDGWDKAANRDEYEELTGGDAAVTRHLSNKSVAGGTDHRGSM